MWLLKNRSRGLYLCFVLLLAMVVGGSAITYADSGTATATVNAGSLTESNLTNRSLPVNKQTRLASYTLPITVTDARGSGKGWKLSITSTRFMSNDKDKDLLPSKASQITQVSVACSVYSTCTNPIDSISYPLFVPAGTTPPPPVKFFDAALRSGLGVFSLTMMVNVTIPANTEQGTYSTTITIAVANGP